MEASYGLTDKASKRYVYVLGSEGDLRESVPEGTEGAVKRDYETSDKKTGTKWEKIYKSIGGKIIDVSFFNGDYGTQLQITFDLLNDQEPVTLSLGTNQPYGEDVMKKLRNVNLNEAVVMTPYNFTDDGGKNRRGVTITQGDEKIKSFYSDGTKSINGMPEPKGKTDEYTKEKWSLYFATVRDFLVEEMKEHVLPQFGHENMSNVPL